MTKETNKYQLGELVFSAFDQKRYYLRIPLDKWEYVVRVYKLWRTKTQQLPSLQVCVTYSLAIFWYALTDLTRCPMPMMSCPFFLMSFTNSMGACPLSNPWENIRAAASNAPPNLSP